MKFYKKFPADRGLNPFICCGHNPGEKPGQSVTVILETLRENGFKAYIAGGAVRDILLKRPPVDLDILTDAPLEKIKSLFCENVQIVGKTFPVCLVNGVEVASGRGSDDAYGFPESDLAGRDFTINAMAYDPLEKKIIDPFNGRKDLEDCVIRFTNDPGQRIKEDPVRMVRACRFAAMIKGSFAGPSLKAVIAQGDLLEHSAAKERIQAEIMKAMALDKPSGFFRALKTTGLLQRIFPSLERCHDLDGGPNHGETVFEHCMLVGDALPGKLPVLRLAGFLHDTGKFDSAKIKDGKLTFIGHENHTLAVVRELERLRFPVKNISYIESLIKSHMRPLNELTTPRAARRLLAMLEKYGLDYRDFMRMRIADKKGNLAKRPYSISEIRVRLEKLFEQMAGKAVFNVNNLEISGKDIIRITGGSPGPEVGRIKNALFEKVLDNPGFNNYRDLEKLCLCFKIEK